MQSENKISDKLTGILGARVDWQKDGEPETIYSGPRAALIFTPQESLTLKYLHNMGVRRPQANEITGSSPAAEKMVADELVIMGNLGGTALAGQPDNENAIILAIGFKPIQIQIGGIIAAGLPTSSAHALEFAHVENGGIVVEDYIIANPFGRLTWPVVR